MTRANMASRKKPTATLQPPLPDWLERRAIDPTLNRVVAWRAERGDAARRDRQRDDRGYDAYQRYIAITGDLDVWHDLDLLVQAAWCAVAEPPELRPDELADQVAALQVDDNNAGDGPIVVGAELHTLSLTIDGQSINWAGPPKIFKLADITLDTAGLELTGAPRGFVITTPGAKVDTAAYDELDTDDIARLVRRLHRQ